VNALAPDTTHHYRLLGINGAGISDGGELTFITSSSQLIGGALASQRLHACQPAQAVSNACELSFDDIATLDHA